MQVALNFTPLKKGWLILTQRHETGQATWLVEPNYSTEMDFYPPGENTLIALTMKIEKKMNSADRPCDETNSIKIVHCVNEYIETKLQCGLPWIKSSLFARKCVSNDGSDFCFIQILFLKQKTNRNKTKQKNPEREI